MPEHLEDQLREMYGRLAYTNKTHEKMADLLLQRYRSIKLIEIALSSLSAGSLLFLILGESRLASIFGAVISTILLGIILFVQEAALGERAEKHTEAAARLWGLRESLISLMVDLRSGEPPGEIRARRDELNRVLESVYRNAPRTNSKAYSAAQRALKKEEELYFSATELDQLLPGSLRSTGKPAP